jgi:hypothetical protein
LRVFSLRVTIIIMPRPARPASQEQELVFAPGGEAVKFFVHESLRERKADLERKITVRICQYDFVGIHCCFT